MVGRGFFEAGSGGWVEEDVACVVEAWDSSGTGEKVARLRERREVDGLREGWRDEDGLVPGSDCGVEDRWVRRGGEAGGSTVEDERSASCAVLMEGEDGPARGDSSPCCSISMAVVPVLQCGQGVREERRREASCVQKSGSKRQAEFRVGAQSSVRV